MNKKAAEEAIKLIKDNGGGYFFGPTEEGLVKEAESFLELKFPEDYEYFLKTLGSGSFMSAEFFGLIGMEILKPGLPNGIWYTKVERERSLLPKEYVVIGSSGADEIYCLKCKENDNPVIVFVPGIPLEQQKYECLSKSFGDFLLNTIKEEII